jgi:hypothetical protein
VQILVRQLTRDREASGSKGHGQSTDWSDSTSATMGTRPSIVAST